ncbi:hypothetical protein EDD85DRAFT_959115 [Armillaria nabsnona]|nr:hypothetical protein EDD85DRAFT_959115 [Armillaria nabsnona]
MRKAPIAWRPILNMSTIFNSKQLLAHVIEHSKALVVAAKGDHHNKISTFELITALKSLGIEPPHHSRFALPHSMNITSGTKVSTYDQPEDTILEDSVLEDEDDPVDSLVKSAFQVLKK